MKTIKTFLFVLICFLPQIVNSQVNLAINFYPLHVGDVWQYKITYQPPNYQNKTSCLSKIVLADTLLTNGKRYFLIEQPPFTYDEIKNLESVFIRIDTVSGIVYKYVSPEEKIDSLFSQLNDHFQGMICWDISDQTVFSEVRKTRMIGSPITTNGNDFHWRMAMNIGIYSQSNHMCIVACTGNTYDLVYAKINGKEYGTLMNRKEETEAPFSFQLSQNYPNPFNPTTIIRFSIPTVVKLHATSLQYVTLKVFDTLGNKIVTLVNEEKQPGSYEVIFDGSNFASGVYFYTLTAGNFSQTKKLLLIK
ncbi:MAG: T9SS type A sorting domain-containing protein [Melioribacteraceae bacterium]